MGYGPVTHFPMLVRHFVLLLRRSNGVSVTPGQGVGDGGAMNASISKS